jgi:hypothetical protein
MRRLTSILIHTAHFGQYTEITLQGVPNWEYTLRLFVQYKYHTMGISTMPVSPLFLQYVA